MRTPHLAMCVVNTAADALKQQGAEKDEDIVFVLKRYCCEQLYVEIEKAGPLLEVGSLIRNPPD